MYKPKIYLAGKMSGLTYEQMNYWREMATILFYETAHCENPCHYYNLEHDHIPYTNKEAKDFDLWLVKNCNIVLVNLEYPDTIGTAIELHMANEWKIPVIAYNKPKNIHPWMDLCVTRYCDSLEDAVDHINKFYLKNI